MPSRKFNFPPKLAPTGVIDVDILNAHTHSSNHRPDLFRSERCGCFRCLTSFAPDAIEDWVDAVDGVGVTALCPACGIDAVLGSVSGYPVESWFLRRMRDRWFGRRE